MHTTFFEQSELGVGTSERDVRGTMWDALAAYITPDINRVVQFAKRLPGM